MGSGDGGHESRGPTGNPPGVPEMIAGGGRAITAGQMYGYERPAPPLGGRFFLLFAVVYLYAFPFFDRLRSANEMPRILMTQELVDRGVFYLDRRLSEFGSTGDLSRGPDGHLYPNKAPGASFLAVPAYLLCKK